MFEYKKVSILGTEYNIETHKISEDDVLKKNHWCGYCSEETKEIVVADMSEDEYFPDMTDDEKDSYRKKTLRHEIMHAFLNESGLCDSALVFDEAWPKNEEMVDWFAIQSPKIYNAFKMAGCI